MIRRIIFCPIIFLNLYSKSLKFQVLKGELVDSKLVQPPPPCNFIASRPKVDLLCWFLSDLDVVCGYLLLFLFYIYIINIEIGKNRC